MTNLLQIKDLHVETDGKLILKGLNLKLEKGKINVLMGPNGSGKSTLANVLIGNPKYHIKKGKILYKGKSINKLKANERAQRGIFLSFQYPQEVSGVTILNFLRTAYNSLNKSEKKISILEFKKMLEEKANSLKLEKDFFNRYLNTGFSGGEKKKSEILQLLTLNPEFAILDETDSGLDIDALKTIANGIKKFANKDKTILLITHYERILKYLKPDKVFIMLDGKIVKEGNSSLVKKLEKQGYGWLKK